MEGCSGSSHCCQDGVGAMTLQGACHALVQGSYGFAAKLRLGRRQSSNQADCIFTEAAVVLYWKSPRHAVAVSLLLPKGGDIRCHPIA